MSLNKQNIILKSHRRRHPTQSLVLLKNTYNLFNKQYIITKKKYNSIIPLHIYQTWNTKNLPVSMQQNLDNMKRMNPEFTFHLYDDDDCANFIRDHFSLDVYNAFNTLIPGAYKADLWRCCILYKYGGIYLDIKYGCVNGFRLIELTEDEHWVKDRPLPLTIYNALMVCQAGNVILKTAIDKIVENVQNRFYGENALAPTGPLLLGKIILNNRHLINLDMNFYYEGSNIIYKNIMILRIYNDYEIERQTTLTNTNKIYYAEAWYRKKIYAD